MRTFDRGASQRIPSGIEAVASIKIRIYGCNLHLTHFHGLRAWQTGATIYDNNSKAGKKFDAMLALADDGKVGFEFEQKKAKA